MDREKELKRMTKQADKLKSSLEALRKRLSSEGFAGKAPPHVVEEVRQTCKLQEEQLDLLEKRLLQMNAIADP